jgi:hypothetical protein
MSFFLSHQFESVECYKCHVVFAMTKEMDDQRRKDRGTFYCPNGHAQHYSGKSDEQKKIDELTLQLQRKVQNEAYLSDQVNNERKKREHANNRVRAMKGQVTKIKKRVGNGVCPCCDRSFANLHAHMKTKHPDYKAGKVSVAA